MEQSKTPIMKDALRDYGEGRGQSVILPSGNIIVDENADPHALYLLGVRYKPIVLAPGQSINDLSLEEQIERGIDWEATGKASAVIFNIMESK